MKKLILVLTLVAVTIFAYSNNLNAQCEYDTTPPEVGDISFSNDCRNAFIIAITDNVAVDLIASASTVEIINNLTKVPLTLPAPIITGDGTPSGTIAYSFPDLLLKTDEYTVTINAVDKCGNKTSLTKTVIVIVTVGGCYYISPTSGHQGESIPFTIKGVCLGLDLSTTVEFRNPGLTLTDLVVVSDGPADELHGTLNIAEDALIGTSIVTVKTGDIEFTCLDFEVVQLPFAGCIGVAPNSITPGETKTITLTVEGIDTSAVTIEDIIFTCPGITINRVKPNGTDKLDVNITATWACSTLLCTGTVLIKADEDLFSSCGSFTVNPGPLCASRLMSAERSPNSLFSLRSWLLLPHRAKIIITGDDSCDFTGVVASDITIEDIKVIEVISVSGNTIDAQIRIPSRISGFKPSEKEVTVNGVGGATLTIN